MHKYFKGTLSMGLAILLLLGLSACASRSYQVRHLDADISMLTPGTSEREVRAILGPPDLRRSIDSGEEWLYLEAKQSRMRRAALVGPWLGHEQFSMARVVIRNDQLVDATFRLLSEAEFKEAGGLRSNR